MDDRGAIALGVFAALSAAVIVLLLIVSRSRLAPGGRLVGAGVLLAILAAWYGLLSNLPPQRFENVRPPYGNPAMAEILMRVAAVLILGGIVTGLLCRDAVNVLPVSPERPAMSRRAYSCAVIGGALVAYFAIFPADLSFVERLLMLTQSVAAGAWAFLIALCWSPGRCGFGARDIPRSRRVAAGERVLFSVVTQSPVAAVRR